MNMTPEQAKFFLEVTLPTFESEYQVTTKVLKAIPADKAHFRPDERSMTAFDLAWHIAAIEYRLGRMVQDGQMFTDAIERVKTLDEVLHYHQETFQHNLAAFKAMPGEQLARIVDFRGMMQLPAVEFISLLIRHTVHHRGQLSTYLRPMGAKVPSMYGESYDDAQERLSKASA